jgi:hypothetical protein
MWWHHPQKISFFGRFKAIFFLKNREFVTKYSIFRKLCHHLAIFCQEKITNEDLMGFSFHPYSFLIFLLKVFIRILERGTRLRLWCILLVLRMNKFNIFKEKMYVGKTSRFFYFFIFSLWLEMNFVCLM